MFDDPQSPRAEGIVSGPAGYGEELKEHRVASYSPQSSAQYRYHGPH